MQIHWQWLAWSELSRDDLYDALALRCRVFILEQGAYLDPDGVDRQAHHLLGRCSATGVLHAYLRAVHPGVKYAEPSLGRVITSPESRGTGLGRQLIGQALPHLDSTWPLLANRISAQAHLRPFYASFGWAVVGRPYLEDNIPHIEMLRPAQHAT